MKDLENVAGYIIAPCGSGKTIMTVKGIIGVKKCIICCPSRQIQNQWYNTLLREQVFEESEIHIIGGAGTTDPNEISTLFENERFCIITTYMSSHLLIPYITSEIDGCIFDEVHHMAGKVTSDEVGEGRTRKLMLKVHELGIKRLSLTYTPRFISNETDKDIEIISMDDDDIFGKKIGELKIRDLIKKGVLPDYRLWMLRDEASKGKGIIGKAECILEAWGATEIIRGTEKHILDHLIIFTQDNSEAKEMETFLKQKTSNTLIMRVEEGDKLEGPIRDFTNAQRAILINCLVLNEGVDIPVANAVVITYPKQSRGQITQMVLRAGRWYEGKSIFHIIIPTLEEEDLSGFEEVLSSLASCDDQISDEIVLRSKSSVKPSDPIPHSETYDIVPECIMIEEFEADQEQIRKCFTNIRKNLFSRKESKKIQEYCVEKSIDTSIKYALIRNEFPEWPEDPRQKNITWYDYLHPKSHEKITPSDFVQRILEPNNLRVGYLYDKWRSSQSPDTILMLPSVQHITDGFFGSEYINFNIIREKFSKKVISRSR